MKILIVGEYVSNGNMILGYYQRALESLGHEVEFFPLSTDGSDNKAKKESKDSYYYHISQRIFRRLHSISAPLRTKDLIRNTTALIDDFKPDVALTSQGAQSMPLPIELLDLFRKKGVPIFNYFTDPLPENNKNFIKTIDYYSGIFTYNRHYLPTWYWYGAKRVDYIPFASDHILHVPKAPIEEKYDYYHSPIAYLGTWQINAEIWPEMIQSYGLKIWGNQWSKLPQNHPLRKAWQGEDRGLFEEFSLICSASNIIFNVIRAFNGQGHSMKTFEIPACRGFAITNRTEQSLEFFPEDEACVYFSTAEELIDKTEYYLKNDKAREIIIENGYQIAIKNRYIDRAQHLLKIFKASI